MHLFKTIIRYLLKLVFFAGFISKKEKLHRQIDSCGYWAVLDVVVDIRKGSPTYGQWDGFILSVYNHRQLLVPKGYAHGFVTLTQT